MSVAAQMEAWVRRVSRAAQGVRCTRLTPAAFFVARSGVLTLAFEGFTEPLLELKRKLGADGAPRENPGSRWPKVTLAAVSGDVLLPEEIDSLRRITRSADTAHLTGAPPVAIREIEIAELRDRCAESVGRRVRIPLSPPVEPGVVDPAHRREVAAVLDQWRADHPGYGAEVSRPAHRERHYRAPHHELSLLCRPVGELPGVDPFREAVEAALPGRYAWFSEESRHVTLRTLGKVDG